MSTDQNGRQIVATLDDLENLAAEIAAGGGGGSGIPQGGPLTEPLDAGEQAIVSAASGSNTGAAVTVATATVDGGGTVEAQAGEHPDGGTGAYMGLFGAEDGAGGEAQFIGGNGIAGAAGGGGQLSAGNGDDGADIGAQVIARPGDGEGAHGLLGLRSNNVSFDVKQAAHVAPLNLTVSDPPEQTEVQAIADGFDDLIASLIAGGWMAAS